MFLVRKKVRQKTAKTNQVICNSRSFKVSDIRPARKSVELVRRQQARLRRHRLLSSSSATKLCIFRHRRCCRLLRPRRQQPDIVRSGFGDILGFLSKDELPPILCTGSSFSLFRGLHRPSREMPRVRHG